MNPAWIFVLACTKYLRMCVCARACVGVRAIQFIVKGGTVNLDMTPLFVLSPSSPFRKTDKQVSSPLWKWTERSKERWVFYLPSSLFLVWQEAFPCLVQRAAGPAIEHPLIPECWTLCPVPVSGLKKWKKASDLKEQMHFYYSLPVAQQDSALKSSFLGFFFF